MAFLKSSSVQLKMLQIKYCFFSSFCDPNKYELIEMDTDSLYMALCAEHFHEIIRPKIEHCTG